uniref:Reverse transcriptase n=1 Tax=Cannabis sativa TaxID=3483 RepID=A0A803Q660_CANSA
MSTISWNCRGLGNPRAFQFLQDICVEKKPNFLFLCETLCKKEVVDRVKAKLGFESCFTVEAQGRKGKPPWRMTGFYGEPQRALRQTTWDLLWSIADESPLPWCILGDFNNFTTQNDVQGGRPYPDYLINGFNLALHDCQLGELELHGYGFTWERGRGTAAHIEIRLDKAFANYDWFSLFPDAKLSNFDYSSSDHTPLFLELETVSSIHAIHLFCYKNAWSREPLCAELVKSCWSDNCHFTLAEKLKRCSLLLSEWGFEITAQQEIYWKQWSKQFWLHAGDKNGKYFHETASSRKRSNQIVQLKNSDDTWVNWSSGLDQVKTDYFLALYTTDGIDCNSVVHGISPSVTDDHNEALLQPVTPEEIKQAVFQMHPDKAPGPDGMGPGFYQHHWDVVGPDIVQLFTNFFETEDLPLDINETNLVLISKKKNFSTMGDLRPIALCNVSYKIVAKVLANRMRNMIDQIISPTQSVFIPGRLISDNIMVAFEIMHYLKRKRRGQKGFMTLKLDMSKAYGIRQGDPLSTYLFIICTDGFSSLIRRYEADRINQGCRVANGAPSVTHMLFANDSYLFCQATQNAADSMNRLLHSFELASGQRVNASKSSIFFSPNTNGAVKAHICSTLGMPEATDGSFYLGLPNIIGRKKTIILGFLKNKIIARLNSWDGKFLSRAGKEILLKTVIQSIPTYAMSVFLIPLKICNDIEKLMASFWWKTKSANGQGIIWKSWDRLAVHKDLGGMGFRHLHDFNLAMLARLLCSESSLASQVIWSAQQLVRLGVRRIIGTGTATSILAHPWLPDKDNPFVTSTTPGLNHHTVQSLFHVHTRSWDDSLVRDMFNARDSTLIMSIPLSFFATNDHWAWVGEKTGHFSVKSAYNLLQTEKSNRLGDSNSGFWRKLWHLKIPPKVKNFMWRAVSDVLPTCLQLVSKGVSVSPMCLVCHHTAETATHILLNCSFALACWQKVDLVPYANFVGTIGHFLHLVFTGFNDDISCRVVMLCWSLWKARNTLVWDKKTSSPPQIVSSAWTILDHWIKAQDKMSLLSPSTLDVGNNFEHWTKPTDNMIKINVDGATFETENEYGYGIVACDSEGNVIDFVAKYFHGSFPAEVVEALGIKEALSWIKDKGWSTIEVETDSLLTIQAVFSQQQMTSVFGLITHDCKSCLSSLPNVSLRFVKRSANKVAHFMAKRSCFYSDRSIHDVDILTDYNASL